MSAPNETAAIPIAVIPGDGIGPELVESACAVLTAATADGQALRFTTEDAGAGTYQRIGASISDETLARLSDGRYAAIFKGPVGLPGIRRPDGTEAGLLGGVLRVGLDLYANVRPIRLLPGIHAPVRHEPGGIDYVVVRENTEGLYLSRGLGVGNRTAVSDQLMVTRPGVERIARFAFDLARTRRGAPGDGRHRVTLVDKSNVLRSFAFFREVTTEVAAAYPDIELDFRYADAAAHDLVLDPGHFDVVVTENFLGDILSDLGAATVGGLGMCGGANIGDHQAYFEPIHGSAPSLAGQRRANPLSQILSGAMMLDHIGLGDAADRIRAAVESGCADGAIRIDDRGQPAGGLDAVTETVCARLDAD